LERGFLRIPQTTVKVNSIGARWLYLGWGALGILAALTSLYFPPGYIVIRVLIFVAFTVVLSWKNSSEFFSRQKKAIQPRQN